MTKLSKIAIPTQDGKLCPHFGTAPEVTMYAVEDGVVKSTAVLPSPAHEHGAMPRFLASQGCTEVVCGGLGAGAVNLLNQLGIEVHSGAPVLPVNEVLQLYLDGSIVYGDGTCHHDGCGSHHHHEH